MARVDRAANYKVSRIKHRRTKLRAALFRKVENK